jgi:branched-chain amino acid transport system permease protein
MMAGTLVAFALVQWAHFPLWLAVGLALTVSALLGVVVERLVIHPLIGESAFSLIMVTVGLSSMLYSCAAIAFGRDVYRFPLPFSETPLAWQGLVVDPINLWTLGVTSLLVCLFLLFFQHSRLGLGMRAIAQDDQIAFLMGIPVKWVFALIWAIGAIVAACGGLFLAGITQVRVEMAMVGFRAFPAAVLGGLDSITGAIVGGLIIGLAENLAGGYLSPYLGGGIKDIMSYVIILLILLVRPYGLFGTEEIERV